MRQRAIWCVLLSVAGAAFVLVTAGAQAPGPQGQATPPLEAGPFTEQQAAAGLVAYQTSCASCHRPDLGGLNEARPLAGLDFMNTWRERTAQELIAFTQLTMPLPPGVPGSLSQQTYVDIVAFLLHANGAQPGNEALTASSPTVIGAVANGVMPQVVRQAAAVTEPATQPGEPSGLTGLTAEGSVSEYSPVTEAMLRDPAPDDWLMIPRQLSGVELQPA